MRLSELSLPVNKKKILVNVQYVCFDDSSACHYSEKTFVPWGQWIKISYRTFYLDERENGNLKKAFFLSLTESFREVHLYQILGKSSGFGNLEVISNL